jgi:hypothetical protein
MWAAVLAEDLNERWLPPGYYTDLQTHASARIECDVPTFRDGAPNPTSSPNGGPVATAAPQTWTAPAPVMTMPGVFPDTFEVRVISTDSGPTLVAVIEIVSPGNKDRPEERRAFATKCASYLYQGISLVLIDIVTNRRANLHNEMIQLMQAAENYLLPPETSLYAVAYRPLVRKSRKLIDLWPATFALSSTLPTLPLALTPELSVPVEFETTYTNACRRLRLL